MALTLTRAEALTEVSDDALPRYDEQIVDADPEVVYTIRPLRPVDIQRLKAPYVAKRFDPRTHAQVEKELTPEQAESFALDMVDYVLVAWAGVLDGDIPAECNRDNKALLDPRRRAALIKVATLNQITRAEDRAASFRATAGVGGVGPAQRGDDPLL